MLKIFYKLEHKNQLSCSKLTRYEKDIFVAIYRDKPPIWAD